MKQQQAVVIGGGFGGFKAVQKLLKKGFHVTLVSEHDYFYFTPLLVEVVVRTLNFRDVSLKFTDYFKDKNFDFVLARAEKVDFEKNIVYANGSALHYDYVVIATGSRRRELPMKGQDLGFPLKNLEQAEILREKLFDMINNSQKNLHVAVAGAGASGIELAFAVEQIARHCKKYPKIEVNVFDGGSSLLPKWNPKVGKKVARLMKKHSINLYLNFIIKEVGRDFIATAEKTYHSDLTVLTLGVVPNSSMIAEAYLNENKYVTVDEHLRIKGLKNAFAIGDIIDFDKSFVPKLAQTAQDQGILAAENIYRAVRKRKLKKYSAKILGNVLTLGSRNSISTVKNFMFTGVLGNVIRAGAYIFKMPGLKEKAELGASWISHTLFKTNLKR